MQRLTIGRPALLAAVLLTVSCGSDHPTDVLPDDLTVSTTTLPPAVQGGSYTATVDASGGLPTYTWTLQSGALPAGIGLDGATGTLSGTATESGDFPVTIRVTDTAPHGTADVVVELALHVESAGSPARAVVPPGPPAGPRTYPPPVLIRVNESARTSRLIGVRSVGRF
jgi:hypothetical protein